MGLAVEASKWAFPQVSTALLTVPYLSKNVFFLLMVQEFVILLHFASSLIFPVPCVVLGPANLNPEELPKEVRDLPKGVYFGWVQVRGEGLDAGVHKMVMNIGNRPTFADGDAITVVSFPL